MKESFNSCDLNVNPQSQYLSFFLYLWPTGAYGQVYKARDPNKDGAVVAIKQIRIRRQGRHYEAGMPMAAIREISLLKQLENREHPNIVK